LAGAGAGDPFVEGAGVGETAGPEVGAVMRKPHPFRENLRGYLLLVKRD